jgi:hypothetical protein
MGGPTSKKTKKTTQEGEPQREHQVPKPPLVARGGPPERTPSLEKPLPIAISRLKIKIAYTHAITSFTPYTYKMCTKLSKPLGLGHSQNKGY